MAHGLQEGACILQHNNGLHLGTHAKLARCWTGLDCNMEQNLWAVAFTLPLLKIRLDFSRGETGGDGTLESQERNHLNFISLSSLQSPIPLCVCVSGNPFLVRLKELHFHC